MGRRSLIAAAALGLALLAGPAAAIDEQAERQRIAATLDAGYAAAYRERDAAKALALYDEKAEIVTHMAGRIDRAAYGRMIGSRLAKSDEKAATVEVLSASFPAADEALISFVLSVEIDVPDGKFVARQDRWYAQLRIQDGSWRIVRQGYREDFGVTQMPHVGH